MRRTLSVLCVILASAACSGAYGGDDRTAAPTAAGTAQVTRGRLEAGGISRSYRLYVPGSLDRSAPAALVVVLHAGLQDGEGAVRIGDWDQEAGRGGTAVELVTIADGGHSWPGGQPLPAGFNPPSDAVDATPRIWAFFAAHPKRP